MAPSSNAEAVVTAGQLEGALGLRYITVFYIFKGLYRQFVTIIKYELCCLDSGFYREKGGQSKKCHDMNNDFSGCLDSGFFFQLSCWGGGGVGQGHQGTDSF